MKKKLILLPILSFLLSGCSFTDIMFWKSKEEAPANNQNDDSKDDSHSEGDEETIHVSSVSLSKSELSIEELASISLSYTVLPENATNKSVEWSTSDGTVASVLDGVITGINPGTATITVTTVDGNKEASCTVTVTKKEAEIKTVTASLIFNNKGYSGDTIENYIDTIKVDDNINVTFAKGEGSISPRCIKYNKVWSARMYPGNELYITSSDPLIKKVEFTFDSNKDTSSNPLTPDSGSFSVDTWTGSTADLTFVAGGTKDFRCISSITVCYEGEEIPEEGINLGVKTINEVKTYINNHPMSETSYGNWTNNKVNVTIKGSAIAKIDTVKTSKTYGDDVSRRGKVIMADSTGYIGAASNVSGDGTTLWGKVDNYQCGPEAKYIVSGYISYYRGNPEIYVTSFTFDKTLNISWNAEELSSGIITLTKFYEEACDVDYNCAGHGYGEIFTINSVKCHEYKSNSKVLDQYKVTDGTKNLNINAYNVETKMSEGSMYNVTGIISLKNYSPIIIAFSIEKVNEEAISFDYKEIATEISVAGLRTITGKQDDTMDRFPQVVSNFGTIYKTTGYLNMITQGELYYIGIGDTYISNLNTESKDEASTTYGLDLIHNDNYWAAEDSEIIRYNEAYKQGYIAQNKPIDIYYVVYQIRYVSKKTVWEIYLLNDFLNDLAQESL